MIDRERRLILLLTPPFDKAEPNPGYIKGYVPGVRENGGQYTHAALWVVLAQAMLRRGDAAHELLSFINPIHRSSDRDRVKRYRVEPYVVAADIYSAQGHVGTRRLDVVHRRRRMDVPGHDRAYSGNQARRELAAHRTLRAGPVAAATK